MMALGGHSADDQAASLVISARLSRPLLDVNAGVSRVGAERPCAIGLLWGGACCPGSASGIFGQEYPLSAATLMSGSGALQAPSNYAANVGNHFQRPRRGPLLGKGG